MAKVGAEVVEELPKAIVRRLVKEKLSQIIACRENDVCKESKRQTINAEDIFKALEEIEFQEKIAGKKAVAAKAKEADKKRKMVQSEVEKEPSTAKAEGKEADKKRKMIQPEAEEEPSKHTEDQEDEEGNEREDEEEADEDEHEEEADEGGDDKEEEDINDREDEEEEDNPDSV
ncbi:hypothetical protein MKX01_031955 [Papaver californicum]|nr:hypothetical protein MKX01_031955 [Papaver californicum]